MLSQIQEALTINDVACNIPKIIATLDGRQADHQSTMVEVQGKISEKNVYVFINIGSTLSYVSPTVFEKCKLRKEK